MAHVATGAPGRPTDCIRQLDEIRWSDARVGRTLDLCTFHERARGLDHIGASGCNLSVGAYASKKRGDRAEPGHVLDEFRQPGPERVVGVAGISEGEGPRTQLRHIVGEGGSQKLLSCRKVPIKRPDAHACRPRDVLE